MEYVRAEEDLGHVLDSGFSRKLRAWERTGDKRGVLSYFCTHLLQLMGTIHLELNLEDDFNHPDNAGWIQVFQNWCERQFALGRLPELSSYFSALRVLPTLRPIDFFRPRIGNQIARAFLAFA